MNTPSAAMIAITSIWNLCSTADVRPQAKENHCDPSHIFVSRADDAPTKGTTWAALTTKRA